MKLAEVVARYPALRELHGGTDNAYHHVLYRAAAPSVAVGNMDTRRHYIGSGRRSEYQLWHLRVTALRLIVHRLLPKASIDDHELREAIWHNRRATIHLHTADRKIAAKLTVEIPLGVWYELGCEPGCVTSCKPEGTT